MCLTGDLMDRENICLIERFIRLLSLYFGKLRTEVKMSFLKKSNDMLNCLLKPQIAATNFSKEIKFNTFGMRIVNSVGRRH